MIVNFDSNLPDLNGKPLPKNDKEALPLKDVCIEALMAMVMEERVNGETKFKRYELALKINKGGEIDVTPEEATMLKERIGTMFGPAVVGPAFKILNG